MSWSIFRPPDVDVTLHISVTFDTHPDINDRRRGDVWEGVYMFFHTYVEHDGTVRTQIHTHTHKQDPLWTREKTENETTHIDVSKNNGTTVGEV